MRPLIYFSNSRCATRGRTALLRHDQLAQERAAGRAFVGFSEGALGFPPTYKYRLGGRTYCGDPLSPLPAEKRRTPAWCDRVLWRGERLQQLAYTTCEPSAWQSDHRPVVAVFELEADAVHPAAIEAAVREAYKEVDRAEMEARAQCTVAPHVLDVGTLRWGAAQSACSTVTNVGEVPAFFTFVSEAEGAPPRPSWLALEPLAGTIAPGETLDVSVSVRVDATATAQAMAHRGRALECIVVLRLVGGQDHFLTVQATYHGSRFGVGLDELSGLPLPLRQPDGDCGDEGRTERGARVALDVGGGGGGVVVDDAGGAGGDRHCVNLPPHEWLALLHVLRRYPGALPSSVWLGDGDETSTEQLVDLSGAQDLWPVFGEAQEATAAEEELIDLRVTGERTESSASGGEHVEDVVGARTAVQVEEVEEVRALLDEGADAARLAAAGVTAAAAMRTLLTMFQHLPSPLLPHTPDSLSQVCESVFVPSAEAAARCVRGCHPTSPHSQPRSSSQPASQMTPSTQTLGVFPRRKAEGSTRRRAFLTSHIHRFSLPRGTSGSAGRERVLTLVGFCGMQRGSRAAAAHCVRHLFRHRARAAGARVDGPSGAC